MASGADVKACFAPGVLDDAFISQKRGEYDRSEPYHHAVVDGLINDGLLRGARHEIVEELAFTEKETDIYKVNQTGDLANLDGLPAEEAARLKNLMAVRNAIYSEEFRGWIQKVTGCGPLSSKKKDMSINDYRFGCQLLNHDDVISTRRVSFILYLPDPDQPWKPEWGGALELYPVKRAHEPESIPALSIPPRWNQYTLFAVQPGHSFHSVEEVVHPTNGRLSISGWFHRPMPDEPGFTQEEEDREQRNEKEFSSLESLSTRAARAEFAEYPGSLEPPLPGSPIEEDQRRFLSHFVNPAYLTPKVQATLYEKFGDDSHVLLSDFLKPDLAEAIEASLRKKDVDDGFVWWHESSGESAVNWDAVRIQPFGTGTVDRKDASEEDKRWEILGPAHRQRYASLRDAVTPASARPVDYSTAASPLSPMPSAPSDLLRSLTEVLFPSAAFRHLLANMTQMIPLAGRAIRANRYRPGLDYTLARSDEEPVLDLTLSLTPDVLRRSREAERRQSKPKGIAGKRAKVGDTPPGPGLLGRGDVAKLSEMWERGDVGGWECYMAPHEQEDDPAVYKSAHHAPKHEEQEKGKGKEKAEEADGDADGEDDEELDEEDMDVDDDDFDGVLLNITPSFNTLNIVLRDEGVMRFVKYLSAAAGGSRWEVSAEFTVGAAEIEGEDE